MSKSPILSPIVPRCNNCKRVYSWYLSQCPDCKNKDIPTTKIVIDKIISNLENLIRELKQVDLKKEENDE